MNIFEALRESHVIQRNLAERLLQTSGDTPERRELFERLKNELFAHAVAEDRYFYIPLMMTDSETEFSNPGWLAIAKKLSETVHHHLQEEEHGFFQQAGKILLDAQKTALAKQYQQEYKKYKKIEKDSLV